MEVAGRSLRIETGEVAKQANGAVIVTYGDTVVSVTAVCSNAPREGIDFFPLTVDYEEKLYAAGKIPGGFLKREGRPTERCILVCRLIDRPIRPLFPDGFRNEVQIVAQVFSADQQNEPDIPALIGAGAALAVSDIPFPSPIAGVRVGYRDGEFLINPTEEDLKTSLLDMVIAGTREAISMVEAGAREVSESIIIEGMNKGHEVIKQIIDKIEELAKVAGKPKRQLKVYEPDKALLEFIKTYFKKGIHDGMRIYDKQAREAALDAVSQDSVINELKNRNYPDAERLIALLSDKNNHDFTNIKKMIMEEGLGIMVVDEGVRPDGRQFNEIRPISSRVSALPRTHGSALFTRGQTQVMSIVTLGAASEHQIIDDISEERYKQYMHHYNFPPFSVGEVRPMRGPGRREIGHGALAERALIPVLPTEEEFPYTIRVVSEVLESNGSTSMASVCGSTLGLMDAGVPLKAPVAGIAMGLMHKDGKYAVLTDIQGMEDFMGEMDFKVAGTRAGVTAMQMDTKLTGISTEIMKEAMEQARKARFFILDHIANVISAPRPELSPYAPRVLTMIIHPDKIKLVIGPGGKIINKIIAETGVKIDIEDDGRISIVTPKPEAGQKAMKIIEDITKEVEVGEVYLGKVVKIMPFGAFVELMPGSDGLVHISQLAQGRVEKVEDVVKIGDEIMVKVVEIDKQGRINLTRKGLLQEEGGQDPEREFARSGGGHRREGPYHSKNRQDFPRKPR